jgi:ABC-type lipoprotein release transport system permease subunit
MGLPPVALTGLRHALEPGAGSSIVPVRSVIIGAVIGVAGVAAVLTFAAGVSHLFDTPRLWGASHDAEMEVGSNRAVIDTAVRDLATDADIRAVAAGYSKDGVTVATRHGEIALEVSALEPRKGDIDVVVQTGETPAAAGEVAIGRARLTELGLDVGDTLEVTGSGKPIDLRVVGVAVNAGTDEVDDALFVTPDTLSRLPGEPVEGVHLLVGVAKGADRAAVEQRHPGLSFAAEPPSIIDNLDELGSLPWLLAGFLAALATAAAAHGLVTAVRRRRRDLGVLRALGFTRGQVASVVGWQAVVIAGIGVVVGVPSGIALGRWVFSLVARSIGVLVEPVAPLLALALILPAALMLALLAAAGPGRAASRLSPATVLRAE